MPALNLSAPVAVALTDARVAMLFDDGGCLLDDGRRARRAVSCLVELQPGDRVLAASGAEGDTHVLHVLVRPPGGDAAVSVPGAHALAVRQPRIALHAQERVDIGSAGDVAVTAAGGSLSLEGRSVFVRAVDSLVQQAEHLIGRAGQYLLDARGLLRLHGEHALITAERDVKVDADRISMG